MKILFLICVVVIVLAAGWTANTQLRLPMKNTPPEGDFVDIGGTSVHYVDRGTGPALFLIHGAGGSSREWTFSMIEKLTSRYRVIAIDRPGHGYTARLKSRTNSAETVQEQADLVAKLATHLDIDKTLVLGQSYGGAVAMAFAVHHPDRLNAAIIVSGVSNLWEGDLDQWYQTTNTWWGKYLLIPALSNLATRARSQDIVDGIFAPDPPPEGYLDHVGFRLSSRISQIQANTGQINRTYEDVARMVPRYGEITAPLEIVHGDQDTTVPLPVHSIPLSGQVKTANLTVLEGIGHMPQHPRETQVIEAIDRAAKRAGLR